MVKQEDGRVERNFLAAGGLYLILIGIAFGYIGWANSRGFMLLLVSGGAVREIILGSIVVFCACRCSLTRSGLASAVVGAVLLALIAKWVFINGYPLDGWIALQLVAAIFLVLLGVLTARRTSVDLSGNVTGSL